MRKPTADIIEKFPRARQIIAIHTISEKRRPEAKERDRETHYYVLTGKAGMRRLKAARLARIIRNHWGIENRLHHVLDRTLREDAQKTRAGSGALILSLLRKCALALLRTSLPKKKRQAYLPETRAWLMAKPKRVVNMMQRPKP